MINIDDIVDFQRSGHQVLVLAKERLEQNKLTEQLDVLAHKRDEDIDTSDIPEVLDWSKAVVGKFYRPKGCPIKPQIELWEILVPTIDRQKTEYRGRVPGQVRKPL